MQHLICPRGHQWSLDEAARTPDSASTPCPVCGESVESADDPPLSVTASGDDTGPFPAGRTNRDFVPVPALPGYEILRECGRGGMGVVYEARQVGLDRVVALQMILAGDFAGTSERARFQTEAEAIARLHHPNIVQVYEVGEHEGRPFLSLEFCAGGSLHRRLAGSPLPPRRAAALVESLADAMAAAHRAGVIHRDLKPANVLLAPPEGDADGDLAHPKITDFGIAKKLDEAGQTHTGAVMGTPSYMAPEQAGGKKGIGPAADIYALGAILYECLTGRPPFKAATTYDTLRQVVSSEPVPPRLLNAKVPADLETICLKCLRKEPEKRYASAAELAADLRRWVDGKPILARPVGPLERLAKWAGRQPAVAALAASLVLVGAVGLAAVLWQWRVAEGRKLLAEENEERAVTASDLASRKAAEADARFRQARDAVEKMLTGVADNRLAGVPQAEQVRRELLGEALAFYQGFLRERGDDPDLIRETARAFRRVGDIERYLGQNDKAEAAYRQALKLLGDEGGIDVRERRATVYTALAQTQAERNLPVEAERSARLALDEHERLAEESTDPRHLRDLAECHNNLGIRLADLRRDEEAERSHRLALKIWDALLRAHPTYHEPRRGLARCHYNLGNSLAAMNRPKEAEASYMLALAEYEKLAKEFPKVADYRSVLARAYGQVGTMRKRAGANAEAEKFYRRSLDWQRALADDYPAVPLHRRDLAVSLYNLGIMLKAQGRGDEAADLYRSSIEVMEKVVADAPTVPGYRRMLSGALYSQANYLRSRQRDPEAVPLFRRAADLQQALVDEFPRDPDYRNALGRTLNNLAQALTSLSRPGEAEPLAVRAVAHQREALKIRPRHPPFLTDLQIHYWTLSDAAALSKRHEEAGRAAAEYARIYPDHWRSHYRSGRLFLACALVAEDDASLPVEKRKALARDYLTKAAEQQRAALRIGTDDSSPWYYLALAEAMLGDEGAYHKTCDGMLKRFDRPRDADTGHWVARTCLLAPGRATPRVVELAEAAVRSVPNAYFYRVWAAAATLRSGQPAQASEKLDAAARGHRGGGTAYDLYYSALTRLDLDENGEARASLDKGLRWVERMEKGEMEDAIIGKKLSQNQDAELRLLRREAEKRLKGKADS